MTSIAPVVEKLLSNHHNHLQGQDKYVFPPGERLDMSQICHSYTFPIIDLKDLDGPHRIKLVNEIRQACEEDGFFQIINHGASETVMKSMMGIAKEFFEMPVEDRVCLNSENLRETVRIFTSFNVTKGQPFEWKDYLRHPCHPLEEFINSWPQKPALYREVAGKYCKELRVLVLRLLAAISEALGQDPDYLNEIFGNHSQVLHISYYRACPNPDLTFGIAPHSDPRGITVLMQGDVSGLEVLKDGKWVAVEPIPNAFVVNLADQLEVISNGRFKSAEHRAVTNKTTARISIPTFYGPSLDTFIAPAAAMVDEEHPALYRGYKFEEYMAAFWSKCGLKGKSILDRFKIEVSP
ncbi:protein DMR6-LIKE OXYGENASE 2 isoform X1 [Cryptomeria japonica]|uniref:protein DMR6-LIKE OXYGENASE 2 isoform X1 n=1 Tax=Cryptomeria japonica TaxID=3369 RepID=UPI0027DA1BFB|nr:protein DMR6-LIKE OXYGENASE 2 isoform X1 [Cryptomeria japonica]